VEAIREQAFMIQVLRNEGNARVAVEWGEPPVPGE